MLHVVAEDCTRLLDVIGTNVNVEAVVVGRIASRLLDSIVKGPSKRAEGCAASQSF